MVRKAETHIQPFKATPAKKDQRRQGKSVGYRDDRINGVELHFDTDPARSPDQYDYQIKDKIFHSIDQLINREQSDA
jgi:hypothetical protein